GHDLLLFGQAPQGVAAEGGEGAPDLLLKEDDDGERQDDQQALQHLLEGRQLDDAGQVVEDADEDDAEEHLHRAGAADQQQQVVDEDGDNQDVDRVAPGQQVDPPDQAHATAAHPAASFSSGPACPAIARQTARNWTVAATSWTRTIAADRAAAQATAARLPGRRSCGAGAGRLACSTALPR